MPDSPTRQNPILKEMGFGPKDRVVVIHVDDVGMCDTTLSSFAELHDFGIVSSGSVMVSCPGFKAAAEWAVKHSHADLGVHLTLTSEWDTYRWGPVAVQNQESGILDEEGYFYKSCLPLWKNANVDNVQAEITAQLRNALEAGMNVSHIDAHMFCCMAPHFFPRYLQLGYEYKIPVFLKRGSWDKMDPQGLNVSQIEEAENQQLPVFDHLFINSLSSPPEACMERTKKVIDDLPPGLSYYLIHPAEGTIEMQGVARDWRARDAEFQVFRDSEFKKYIQHSGLHVISYKEINDVLGHN